MKFTYIPIVLVFLYSGIAAQSVISDESFEFPPISSERNRTYLASERIYLAPTLLVNGDQNLKFLIGQPWINEAAYGSVNGAYSDRITNGLDESLAVGATPGNAGVSPTGAATYSVPIQVPPGTAGMVPSLSVNYNSQGGNGLLGTGWSLGGISAITRTGSTPYHDGEIRAVQFDDGDNFAWDGQRLIEVGDGQYRTEIESFAEITAVGNFNGSPSHFEVKTKDGKTLYYGMGQYYSRLYAADEVHAWYLTRVEDHLGNYMVYNYEQQSWQEIYLQSIEYTGNKNTGLSPYNKVEFTYRERWDKQTSFLSGQRFESTLLLTDITTYAQGAAAKRYFFKYFYNQYSHLESIEEYAPDGSLFNATVFGWGGHSGITNSGGFRSLSEEAEYDLFFGDFNGDGRSDALQGFKDGGDVYTKLELEISDGNVFTSASEKFLDEEDESVDAILVADIDGDGIDEIITRNDESDGPSATYITYKVNQSNYSLSYYDEKRISGIVAMEFFGDIMGGDGIKEIFIIRSTENTPRVVGNTYYNHDNTISYYSDYMIYNYVDESASFFYIPGERDNVKASLCDFNGDGRMNPVLRFLDGDVTRNYVIGYDKDNRFTFIYEGGYPSFWHDAFYDDFSGDGISDILAFHEDGGWEITRGTGTGWEYNSSLELPSIPEYNHISDPSRRVYVADLNGDGKSDILVYYSHEEEDDEDGPSYVDIDVYYSNGKSFEHDEEHFDDWKADFDGSPRFSKLFDKNGDGRLEVAYRYTDDSDYNIVSFRRNSQKNFVTHISNGLNHRTEFHYNSLSHGSAEWYGGYTSDDSEPASSSIRHLNIPLWVVSSMLSDNGNGTGIGDEQNEVSYSYTGAKLHKEGKGFLGFDKIVVNSILGRTTTENELNTTYYISRPARTETIGATTTTVTYNNQYQTHGGLRVFPYVDDITSTNSLNGISTVDYDYNLNNGNLNLTETDYGSGYTSITSYVYEDRGDVYRVTSSTLTKTRPEGTKTWTTTNTYNDKDLLETATANGVITEYTYDNYGNPTSTTISASGLVSRTSSVEYDDKYRWPIKKTNALGHSSSYLHSKRFGNIISETDPNGLVTGYEYDGFGRLKKATPPVGSAIETTLAWGTSDKLENTLYYSLTSSVGAPDARSYYDKFGRRVLTQTIDFTGRNIYTTAEYNRYGKKYRESEPFTDYTDELDKQYTYYSNDRDLRPTSITVYLENAVSCVTSFSYLAAHQTQVSTCDGQNKTTQNNPDGSVAWISDDGGKIDYEYNTSGQVAHINVTPTGMATSTTTIEYDGYGNQKSLDDPNAGTMLYTYNAFGELLNQSNNKGQTTSYTYDILGRVKTETGPDLSNIYLYDTEVKGALTSVTGTNTTTSYTYDSQSRVSAKTKVYNGNSYVYGYSYDATTGQLDTYTYPTGYTTQNVYTTAGYLQHLKRIDGGHDQTLWTCNSMNKRGSITGTTLGNDFTQIRGYEATYGMPTRLLVYKMEVNPITALDHSYSFNSTTGNLDWRSDPHRDPEIIENFGYSSEGLNRLEEIHQGTDVFAIGYDGSGNITSKYDAGHTYDYTADTRPHAVNEVLSDFQTMSELDQDIDYNSFEQPLRIALANAEGVDVKTLDITYDGITQQRIQSVYENTDAPDDNWERTYLGDYEILVLGDNTHHLHYIAGTDGLCAIHVITEGANAGEATYYISTDYLGNILLVTDQDRNTVQEYSYDAWGRRRNPDNWNDYNVTYNPLFYRGFTGHEHLDEFGLVNMNGRLYDPILGRMLSPDNYVQSASSTQSFNRYAYCFNNPLIYTDPDGEWIWAIPAAVGFAVGYVSHGATTGDWGWSAVGAGAIGAGVAVLGFYSGGATSAASIASGFSQVSAGHAATVALGYSGRYVASAAISSIMPSISIPVGDNVNVNVSPGVGFGSGGFTGGVSVSGTYSEGKNSYTLGGGLGSNYKAWGASASFNNGGFGIGYHRTYYGGSHNQIVGGLTLSSHQFAFRIENDFFGDGDDRWRSNAFELSLYGGALTFGTSIYNNNVDETAEPDMDGLNYIGKRNRSPFGAWKDGETYHSPAWIGVRSGNNIARGGMSHPLVQDRTQNVVHKWFGPGRTNYFNRYTYHQGGTYSYYGYQNPYSLW